jgi:hypothetical protein
MDEQQMSSLLDALENVASELERLRLLRPLGDHLCRREWRNSENTDGMHPIGVHKVNGQAHNVS